MLLIYGLVALATAQNAAIITSGTGPMTSETLFEKQDEVADYINVTCTETNMCIKIDTQYFPLRRDHPLEPDAISMVTPDCRNNRTVIGSTLIVCTKEYGDPTCPKVFNLNSTHASYQVTLNTQNTTVENTAPNGATNITIFQYELPFSCTYPLDYLLTLSSLNGDEYGYYIPKIYTPKLITLLIPDGEGKGEFPVVMLLYENQDYQNVYQESPTIDSPANSVIQARECWATPTSEIAVNRFDLITDYCASPVENIQQDPEVNILNNGDTTDVRWTSKVFKFDGTENNRVYLHCRARICFNTNGDPAECDKLNTCANRRRRALVGSGGLGVSPAEEYSEEVELTTGPIYITENGAKFVVAGEDGDEVAVPVQIAEVGTLSPYVAWMIIGTVENFTALVLVMVFLSLLLVIVVKKRVSK
ncbi:Oidioi.mRNA.OKI2018_I69.XSR.g14550.t1.cds [Oikopleura dioica]|uniref:Oidioi.mRNA.OKI2018_I69.XSR.g14550.t1.cds n=1 Tax=Oikopleura dioica TaxID=34765 RepID=A0ABN7SE44_OIKDI|nr:Oidioi.mRNA.OKI2018_I69.XSR.g14550.t1.cds [Oikopleura dioica]